MLKKSIFEETFIMMISESIIIPTDMVMIVMVTRLKIQTTVGRLVFLDIYKCRDIPLDLLTIIIFSFLCLTYFLLSILQSVYTQY